MSEVVQSAHPTIAELCARLPGVLVPDGADPVPATPISAVHISELRDPTPYLDGGELLLTTGITLPGRARPCQEYVDRIVGAGVVALAIGLGPVHAKVPAVLRRAAEGAGLPLLVVPDAVPFLTVTRGFWEAVGQEHERDLYAALDADRRLVAAAGSGDPTRAVLRALADSVQGWAALTDPRGAVRAVWPADRGTDVPRLAAEIERLRSAGARSAATFPLDDQDVVLHPVLSGDSVVGYLATVSGRAPRPTARRIVLVALALLGLQAAHRQGAETVDATRRTAVAHLVDARQTRAARHLAGALGVEFPPPRVRVLAASGPDGASTLRAIVDAVASCRPEQAGRWVGAPTNRGAWMLLPAGLPAPTESALAEALAGSDPEVRVAVGPVADLADVPVVRARLEAWLADTEAGSAGTWAGSWAADRPGGDAPIWARRLLEPITTHRRTDLVGAVSAYLRHRGHWEAAARELDVHRNTLRARIARAESLLGRDLTDPDAAAQIWLALRVTARA